MPLRPTPLFVLPLLAMAPVAQAADPVAVVPIIVPPPPAPIFAPLTYISIEGGPVRIVPSIEEIGGGGGAPPDKFGDIPNEEGFYLGATYRRLFAPMWDWQATLTGTWTGVEDNAEPGGLPIRLEADLDFQTLDIDAGFHPGGNPLTRILAGVRILHAEDFLSYTNASGANSFWDAESWLFGPRIGIQSETPIGAQFALVAEASASILFGNADINGRNEFQAQPDELFSLSDSRTVSNLEGLVGVAWYFRPNAALTVGYRAQKWWGLREGTSTRVEFPNGDIFSLRADPDPLIHGPFARIGFTFGGP